MNKTLKIVLAFVAFAVSSLLPLVHAQSKIAAAGQPSRIVIQVNEDDSKKWHSVLGNIRNIQADLGKDNVKVALVAIGPGLGMLLADSLAANDVQDAIAGGVEVIACGNTMKAQKIKKEDLVDGIGVTQAGYVEIVRRQEAGWSYVRP
jgi:intracellular sulfur oxidation DsrE/DsrF family protein